MIRVIAAAVLATVPLAAQATPLGPFGEILVFGDSLSDSGNVAFATGAPNLDPPIYPDGQFTDGDTWATQLGLAPSLLGGTNYAWGSARATANPEPDGGDTDPATDNIPDLLAQIAAYDPDSAPVGDNPLAAIWVGGNDLLAALSAPAPGAVVAQAITDILIGIGQLSAKGITNFAVFGLPDLGSIPRVLALGPEIAGRATAASQGFNASLAANLPESADFIDIFGLFGEILVAPETFGFTETEVSCIADLTVGATADCDGYLFFDTIHPTEQAHALIAAEFRDTVAPVPLPAGAALLLTAAAGLAAAGRRKTAA